MIINADDFGLTAGVTAGIRAAMLCGAVTSTSVMACVPGSLERTAEYANELRGRIGVHLQLTDGIACCQNVPSLVDEEGCFPRSWRDIKNLDRDEIHREWCGQMERVLAAGIRPSHIDTHHDVHRFPVAFKVYCHLASEYGLSARTLGPVHTAELRRWGVRCTDAFETAWGGEDLTTKGLLQCAERAFALTECESIELMTHPGFCDDDLRRKSGYTDDRERELEALCDPELRALLDKAGVCLGSIRDDGEFER